MSLYLLFTWQSLRGRIPQFVSNCCKQQNKLDNSAQHDCKGRFQWFVWPRQPHLLRQVVLELDHQTTARVDGQFRGHVMLCHHLWVFWSGFRWDYTRMDIPPTVMLRAEVRGKSFRCWVCDGWPPRRLVLRPFLLTVPHLQIPFSGIGDKLDLLFSRCESEDKFRVLSQSLTKYFFSPIVNHSVRRVSWIPLCSEQLPPAELSSTSSVPCGGGKMRERE